MRLSRITTLALAPPGAAAFVPDVDAPPCSKGTRRFSSPWPLQGAMILLAIAVLSACSTLPLISDTTEPNLASDDEVRLVSRTDLPLAQRALVVMIHGWGGHPAQTWLRFPELLSKNLPDHFDVVSIGYPSGLKTQSPSPAQIVKWFSSWLRRESGRGNNAAYGSYVLIAHSFGGIVAKQYVVNELSFGRRVRTNLVFLIGTPNLGDDFTKLAVYIPFIPKEQLRRLADDEFLSELHERYMIHTAVLAAPDVDRAVIQPVRTVAIFGKSDRDGDGVVNVISASAFFPDSRIVFKDHVSLVKPASEADDVFVLVLDEILRTVRAQRAAARTSTLPFDGVRLAQHATDGPIKLPTPKRRRVIFVPGFGGGPESWNTFIQLMKTDPAAKNVDLVRFDSKWSWSSKTDVASLAAQLGPQLTAPNIETSLVCHSLGATICQEAVLQLLRSGRASNLNVRKAVFLAPPTTATDLQAFQASGDTFGQLKGFKTDLSYLANLQKEWFSRVTEGGDSNLPLDFRTQLDVVAVLGVNDTVVKTGLSKSLFNEVQFMAVDHLGLLKPTSRDDATYKAVVNSMAR